MCEDPGDEAYPVEEENLADMVESRELLKKLRGKFDEVVIKGKLRNCTCNLDILRRKHCRTIWLTPVTTRNI